MSSPPLQLTVDRFLRIPRSKYTNRNYAFFLRRLLDFAGAGTPVGDITFDRLADFMAALRQRHIAPMTEYGYASRLITFFGWCVEEKFIARSPARLLKMKMPLPPPVNRAIPADALQRLLNAAHNHPRNYAALMVLIDTGCRIGGLESLSIEMLNLDDCSAWIKEKGDRWVEVFFGEETRQALQDWLRIRGAPDHPFVWTALRKSRRPMTRAGLRDMIYRLCEDAGLPRRYGPHSIRHSVGHAYSKRESFKTTQNKLNHVSASTTIRYYYPRGTGDAQDASRRLPLSPLQDAPLREPRSVKIIRFPGT